MEINFIPQTIYVYKLDYLSKSVNMVRSFLEEIDRMNDCVKEQGCHTTSQVCRE